MVSLMPTASPPRREPREATLLQGGIYSIHCPDGDSRRAVEAIEREMDRLSGFLDSTPFGHPGRAEWLDSLMKLECAASQISGVC